MGSMDITSVVIDGKPVDVFPHKVRTTAFAREHGWYNVTLGGYLMGQVRKIEEGRWNVLNDRDEVIREGVATRTEAARFLAIGDEALETYRRAALEGTWGYQAEDDERRRRDALVAEHDALPLVEVEVEEIDYTQTDQLDMISTVAGNVRSMRTFALNGEVIGKVITERRRSVLDDKSCRAVVNGQRTGLLSYAEAKQAIWDLHHGAQSPEDALAGVDCCQEAINGHGGVCGAPLDADGTCPGVKLHVASMHQRDRTDALQEAARQVGKALDAQLALDTDDFVLGLLGGLQAQINDMAVVAAKYDS